MKYIMYSITPQNSAIKYAYIGHTINFGNRKYQHKMACKSNDKALYKIIRENDGFDCWEMKPLEEYDCDCVTQARLRERYWYDRFKEDGYNMCNMIRPLISSDERSMLFAKGGKWYEQNLNRARERSRSVKILKNENEKLKRLLDAHSITY